MRPLPITPASTALTDRPVLRALPVARRLRVELGGVTLADSLATRLVQESGRTPHYLFPLADVALAHLRPAGSGADDPLRGPAMLHDVEAGGRVARAAAWTWPAPPAGAAFLAGHVAFAWDAMDRWLEEDEEVFFHARDPHVRIDILMSRRRVTVTAAGVTVATTTRGLFLYEAGEPLAIYMPAADVRRDLLVESTYLAGCPYKGLARHNHVRVGDRLFENAVYRYDDPVPESRRIAGLLCFDPGRIDAIEVAAPEPDRLMSARQEP